MSRLWEKGGDADEAVLRFTVGEDYQLDLRLVPFDLRASAAHVEMLVACGHLDGGLGERLLMGLAAVGEAFARGEWTITPEEEDCHTAIENQLTALLGAEAGSMHLGRSRNDQVLVALRLYLQEAVDALAEGVLSVTKALEALAETQGHVPMPGYTHGQRAMPSSVGQWALGFAAELRDDAEGLQGCQRRLGKNPLGSAAGYGTPGLPLDRNQTTAALGFDEVHEPVTAVQISRGKAEAEVVFACVLAQQDLGRVAADVCLFATAEFGFVQLPERFTTGSSIMPQKRNPDVFELVRGRSSQSAGELVQILGLLTKMPSGYHRDLQLIKPPLFRAIDSTLELSLVMAHVLPGLTFDATRTQAAMDAGLYATEEAFRLTKSEGIPFREAYRRVAQSLKSLEI